jgi:hypothetical protein
MYLILFTGTAMPAYSNPGSSPLPTMATVRKSAAETEKKSFTLMVTQLNKTATRGRRVFRLEGCLSPGG